MDKWVCQRCGNEITDKPYRNQICNKDGCKGRYKQLRLCECGKWFYTNDPNRKYCSNECTARPKRSIELECAHCGKTFKRAVSNCRNSKLHFCDIECQRLYEKTLKEERVCKYCGNHFTVYKSAVEKTNASGNYCSCECYYKAMEKEGTPYYRADFGRIKRRNFKGKQFCAICGTTKNIHIHHIIPFKLTQDNSLDNLIPLCSKHHVQIERMSEPFISSMTDDLPTAKMLLNNILRERQTCTRFALKRIAEHHTSQYKAI